MVLNVAIDMLFAESFKMLSKAPKIKRIATWGLLVLWCLLIWYLSDQPDLRISDHNTYDFLLRKFAHMAAYGILAIIASMTALQEGARKKTSFYYAGGIAFAWACLDEYHQSWVQGRHGTPVDVAIDSVGAALALIAVHIVTEKNSTKVD